MGENEIDQALVKRVQAGEKRAFDLLVIKYQHKVTSLISRYVYDWSECQDVAQETFIRAYRALGNFRARSCGKPRWRKPKRGRPRSRAKWWASAPPPAASPDECA
jgi:DNA-directed RNA polymerase specialized sigma24 family protein